MGDYSKNLIGIHTRFSYGCETGWIFMGNYVRIYTGISADFYGNPSENIWKSKLFPFEFLYGLSSYRIHRFSYGFRMV